MINYHPTVCYQTETEHVHYNIIMNMFDDINNDYTILRRLASKVGGLTAGQLITNIKNLINLKLNIGMYGIEYMQMEKVPLYQICRKSNLYALSVDWYSTLFVDAVNVVPIGVKQTETYVAKIKRS